MRSATLHISKYPPFRGGMDKVLRLHAADGAESSLLLNLLRLPGAEKDALGASNQVPMSWLRRRLAGAQQGDTPGVSLYYNCWGADVLGKSDRAEVRIGYLHNIFPQFERYVRHYSQYLDGFLSVSAPMHAIVSRVVPDETRGNSSWVPLGVDEAFQPPAKPPGRSVIGVCGRIVREQKRVDRLPEVLGRLDRTGLDYRLEILGDGSDRAWLGDRIGAHPRVVFHGWCEGPRLVGVMQGWKYSLTVSDFEGGQSLALLEGIAAGCLPIYPDFHAGQELPPVSAQWCLYPPGDLDRLVSRLLALERAKAAELAVIRSELAALRNAHRPAGYAAAFAAWREAVRPVERRRPGTPWRRLVEPVWAYNRFYKRLTHGP